MTSHDDDPGWSKQHRTAIRETAPAVPPFSASEQDALWQQIQQSAATARPRRPRRWRTVIAGAVALGAVGVAGAAAANVISAHSGKGPSDAEDIELGGPGERLIPSAPDFAAVLDKISNDIRFPSAQSRDRAVAWEVDDLSDEQGAIVSTGALRYWMAGHSLCAWSDTWAVALRTGDTATERRAASVILEARDWPAITAIDGDLLEEAAWVPRLEQAIRTEDLPAATSALLGQPCMPGLAPELGLGDQ